jgi:hypothetical protein
MRAGKMGKVVILAPRSIRVYHVLEKGRKLPPGTTRIWGRKRVKKMGNGEWKPVNVKSYSDSVKSIVEKIHREEKAGIKKPQEPLVKISIGKVDDWLIKKADDQGVDIHGYVHEISNYFIRHVIRNHGDEKREIARGNLPVTDDDFQRIPAIIEHPDYIIIGAKRNNEERIIYVKSDEKEENGTTLYFEEILRGSTNRSLRGNTMYKTKKTLNQGQVLANIKINGKTDLSDIKIASMDGD